MSSDASRFALQNVTLTENADTFHSSQTVVARYKRLAVMLNMYQSVSNMYYSSMNTALTLIGAAAALPREYRRDSYVPAEFTRIAVLLSIRHAVRKIFQPRSRLRRSSQSMNPKTTEYEVRP